MNGKSDCVGLLLVKYQIRAKIAEKKGGGEKNKYIQLIT